MKKSSGCAAVRATMSLPTAFCLIFCLCIPLLFLTGCGGGTDPAGSTVENEADTSGQSGPGTMADLETLAARAKRLEDETQFQQAASVWEQIAVRLEKQFGAGCWQAVNPRYNAHLATLRTGFDDSQLEQFQQVSGLIDRVSATDDPASRIPLLQSAIAIQEQLYGAETAVVGKQYLGLAAMKQAAGDLPESISDYHKGIEILRWKFCNAHPEIVAAMSMLGELYLDQREYRTAIVNYKQAAKMAVVVWGENSEQYARQANQLGVAYYRGGELATAEGTLKAAEAIRRNALGERHPLVGHSLLNLGTVYIDQRNYSSAIGCLNRAVGIFESHGESADFLERTRSKLSTAYMLTGQPEMAQPILIQIVQAKRDSLGGDHPDTASAEFRLGIALSRQGNYDQAEPLFQQALSTQRKNFGVNNRDTIKTMQAYAMLMARTGRENEARQLSEEIERVASRPDTESGRTFRRP